MVKINYFRRSQIAAVERTETRLAAKVMTLMVRKVG